MRSALTSSWCRRGRFLGETCNVGFHLSRNPGTGRVRVSDFRVSAGGRHSVLGFLLGYGMKPLTCAVHPGRCTLPHYSLKHRHCSHANWMLIYTTAHGCCNHRGCPFWSGRTKSTIASRATGILCKLTNIVATRLWHVECENTSSSSTPAFFVPFCSLKCCAFYRTAERTAVGPCA